MQPVYLIDKYLKFREKSNIKIDAFFVANNNFGLKNQPIGVHYFGKFLKKQLEKLGLPLNLVPHSIRATTATQLFNHGVPEQLISEVTGHKSNAVRTYKHTSLEQTLNVQSVLNPGFKRKKDAIFDDFNSLENQTAEVSRNIANYTQNSQNNSNISNTNQGVTRITSIFKEAQFQNCTININLAKEDNV